MLLTMVLLGLLYVVFMSVLWVALESIILVVALLGVFSLGQLLYSDKLALRSLGASEVDPSEYPGLHQTVERLAQQADLPKPTVAVAESKTPNAFATGRSQDSATVCVTTGLLGTLSNEELEGVLAHELAHVKNRDVIVMTIASFLSTIAFLIVRWGWLFSGGGGDGGDDGGGGVGILGAILVSLVVWVVSFLLIRALSRYREYAADRGAAVITGDPAALASALETIDSDMQATPSEDLRDQAEMNAFFIIPIDKGIIGRIASTHPSTEKRIENLRTLQRELET
ncbi:MAG: heat shock protein, MEROPS family M48B metallopeptidase [halophilic archaeon J07HX64]|nr:MAG: heat shock protein, MEROPS family M48B metallopeptidase [halophilic archaeon J07HX64]